MKEHIVIVGAGIAGLCAAMALARPDRRITVLDRDPPPPDFDPDQAFYDWTRRGVAQLRHSHVFLGRLVTMLRDRHPALWETLVAAGAREFTFGDSAPPALRSSYTFLPGDEKLSFLFCRRSTLELIMRRYAASLPGVDFVTEIFVNGIDTDEKDGALAVTSVRGVKDEKAVVWSADAYVDASGRTSQFPDWLRAAGAEIREEESPTGILYFTRHYRLRDGAAEPDRGIAQGAGDLGYIKYGVFAADNSHFSITLACPEIETNLRIALPRPEVFDRVCALMPGTARWTDPSRAEPVSKVFAMGALKNVWRHFVKDSMPVARNFFPIGDALIRSNPLYGRGGSMGAIEAFVLGDVCNAVSDPVARMVAYDRGVHEEIRPFFDAMARQDQHAIRRAEREQSGDGGSSLRGRLTKSFVEDAIGPASRGDAHVLRELMRSFHMHEPPTAWTRRADVMARVLAMWARPRNRKADLYPPPLGPERAEMLMALNL
ncbi:MAG: FAD-dependent oxidoreductase [Hyphomonadaceae bacterium]|nr:FAD-dependent oxidoreductase [Hyphomonadaceae bacterium]